MLLYGIPSYRLPDDDLDRDINAILSTGIQVKLDVDIGREITFDQIRSEYDSVYIAIGAQIVNRMNIPGQDSEGVLSAVELLGAVVLMLTGSNSADAVSATVAAIVGLPLFVQGIALIDYLLTRNGKNIAMKRILAYVLIAALLPSLASALLFAGCAEQVLHIRDSYDRLKQYRDTQQNGGGHA